MERRSTKTFTETMTKNGKTVTKTVTEVTITKADGSTETQRTETITDGPPQNVAPSGAKPVDSGPAQSKPPPSNYKPTADMEKFISDAVKRHNELRNKHGSPPLKHAADLSEYAQNWANKIAADNKMKHSPCTHGGCRIGENIAYKWTSDHQLFAGHEAVDNWYKEMTKPGHDFTKDHQPGTGHFTQVVWKGTNEVGMGMAVSKDGSVFAVGSYRPAGNMIGSFKQNVEKPKF